MYSKLLPRMKFILFVRLLLPSVDNPYCIWLSLHLTCSVCLYATMLYAMTLIQMTIYMIDNVKVIKAHIHVAFGVSE